ncbi:MAG: hypothetical protein KDK65_01830, partial [Chlamydiia bacterium]|nr:hypothetical protein [Chlamydiia bacterium]
MEELHLLRQNPNFLQEINSLGFTPWEMACLLDKKEAKQILNPTNPSFLQVIPKGETEKQILSEKEFGELMGIHYLPCLKFSSSREIEKIQSRCPYLFRYTPLGKENRQIGQGYRDWFFSGELPNLLVKWI